MIKLREGKEYKFLVEKELTLPDGSNHFLLIGPDENKYLVPHDKYVKYGISVGSSLKCRVDRISCKGEFFLEPESPWYKEGKFYDFPVIGTDKRIDNTGTMREVVIVEDQAGNKILLPNTVTSENLRMGTKLRLKVEMIKKGKVHLVFEKQGSVSRALIARRIYEFEIGRVELNMDDEECFVVRDPFGGLHTLIKSYYDHYGLKPGVKFKGKIIKKRTGGEIIIEPVNPFYKEGSITKMEITGYNKSVINNLLTLQLKDKYGFFHYVYSTHFPDSGVVRCKVIMIRKGKPLLELLYN